MLLLTANKGHRHHVGRREEAWLSSIGTPQALGRLQGACTLPGHTASMEGPRAQSVCCVWHFHGLWGAEVRSPVTYRPPGCTVGTDWGYGDGTKRRKSPFSLLCIIQHVYAAVLSLNVAPVCWCHRPTLAVGYNSERQLSRSHKLIKDSWHRVTRLLQKLLPDYPDDNGEGIQTGELLSFSLWVALLCPTITANVMSIETLDFNLFWKTSSLTSFLCLITTCLYCEWPSEGK